MSEQESSNNIILSKELLRHMNDERVFIRFSGLRGLEMYALVAYHSDDTDGDDVYLTNNLGGRSTYEEVLEQGGEIYRQKKNIKKGV